MSILRRACCAISAAETQDQVAFPVTRYCPVLGFGRMPLQDVTGMREPMETRMNTVTLSVASREDVTRRALAAFDGKAQGSHISFASAELLWQTFTRKRWELLQAMTGQGTMSIREAARKVGRDVKAVHGDVQALLGAGVLDRTDEGDPIPL